MMKRIADALLRRRHTDSPLMIGRRVTQHLATEEIVAFAEAVFKFGEPNFMFRDESLVPRLVQWAKDIKQIYGPEAELLRKEREG